MPRLTFLLSLNVFFLLTTQAFAQSQPPRLINPNQIDQNSPAVERRDDTTLPPTKSPKHRLITPPGTGPTITLQTLSLRGSSLSPLAIRTFWSEWKGRRLAANQLQDVAAALKQFYSENDYALYAVTVPEQDLRDGHLVLNVTEGHIGKVEFVGDVSGDLTLVRAYSDKILADKPLKRSTFQRYVLLMGDIPGLSVDPAFLPLYPERGIITLEVALERKPVEFGMTYNNQGLGSVSRSQFDTRLALNSMLRQGDLTELGYGFPDDFERYNLYSVFHEQPVGPEGTRASLYYSALHSEPNDFQEGKSFLTVLRVTHPLYRSRDDNVFLSASFDKLDNKNAILRQIVSNESTRVVRLGISADTVSDKDHVTSGYLSLSKGLEILGARQDFFFGGPEFLKGNLQLRRDQNLPGPFALRLRGHAQFTGEPLPSSEQIIFGGMEYGGAFEIARFAADRGVVTAGELAYSFSMPGRVFTQPEIYAFADWAYLDNIDDTFLPSIQRASSAGIGLRTTVFDHVMVQFQMGHPLETPDNFNPNDNEWRYFIQIRSAF